MPKKATIAVCGLAIAVATGGVRAEGGAQEAAADNAQSGQASERRGAKAGGPEATAEKTAEQAPKRAAGAEGGQDSAAARAGTEAKNSGETQATEEAADLGRVARAAFARHIEQREPVDKVSRLQPSAEQVYYFTELRDMAGQTVTHRWKYRGETKAEVAFEVGGPRWRVYSSKDFLPDWTGEWTVEVVTGDGQVVHRDTITYGPEPGADSQARITGGRFRGDGGCGPYGV
jgi:hypothetical protein